MVKVKEVILLGSGGHCHSCIDVIETTKNLCVLGVCVAPKTDFEIDHKILGYPILGNDLDLPKLIRLDRFFHVAVGQIKSAMPRKKIFENLENLGAQFTVIKSNNSHISPRSTVGLGSIVMHGVKIGVNTVLGKNNIFNTGCSIDHDVIAGDHCHISTGAIVNGGVEIGNCVFIGSGAIVGQGVRIGSGAVISAGSVILKDIEENAIIRGKFVQ